MAVRIKLNQAEVTDSIARRNMSKNMLAIRIGISSGYLSQLMHGSRCPSPKVRRRLLKVLKPLTFDDIFIVEEIRRNDGQSR